ncbi:MAG: Hsp20/alpha crystallin family protein [bacterium]|nr:Hsp20/alpha crystallin family protein [bacterium]
MDDQTFFTQLKDLKMVSEDADSDGADDSQLFDTSGQGNAPENDDYSGQLAVDVYQTDKNVVIKSTIAGVQPEDLDITINNDLVTIKGVRRNEENILDDDYIYRECHWGGFSRSIILPVDVHDDKVSASLKNGILTITLPKTGKSKVHVVPVDEEVEN